VSELEFNVPFQHKHGYIRDDTDGGEIWHGGASVPNSPPPIGATWRPCGAKNLKIGL